MPLNGLIAWRLVSTQSNRRLIYELDDQRPSPRGHPRTECAHADLYAAVDELADKLDRQVLRYKGKTQDHNHESAKRLM